MSISATFICNSPFESSSERILQFIEDANEQIRNITLIAYKNFTLPINLIASKCPNLERIQVIESFVEDNQIQLLACNCKMISSFALIKCSFVTDWSIYCGIASMIRLVRVDLEDCVNITEQALIYLVERNKKLEKLNVSGCIISDRLIESISRHCKGMRKLKFNRCTGLTLQAFINLQRSCPFLTHLSVRETNLPGYEMSSLFPHPVKLEISAVESSMVFQAFSFPDQELVYYVPLEYLSETTRNDERALWEIHASQPPLLPPMNFAPETTTSQNERVVQEIHTNRPQLLPPMNFAPETTTSQNERVVQEIHASQPPLLPPMNFAPETTTNQNERVVQEIHTSQHPLLPPSDFATETPAASFDTRPAQETPSRALSGRKRSRTKAVPTEISERTMHVPGQGQQSQQLVESRTTTDDTRPAQETPPRVLSGSKRSRAEAAATEISGWTMYVPGQGQQSKQLVESTTTTDDTRPAQETPPRALSDGKRSRVEAAPTQNSGWTRYVPGQGQQSNQLVMSTKPHKVLGVMSKRPKTAPTHDEFQLESMQTTFVITKKETPNEK